MLMGVGAERASTTTGSLGKLGLTEKTGSSGESDGLAPRKKKVAIIGSGMAGLVTAFLLRNDSEGRFEVEVLEMQERLSLDSASYTLPSGFSSGGSSSAGTERGRVNLSDDKDGEKEEEEGEGSRRVDLPMRAFAAGYYNNLRKMYTYLGVEFEEPRFVYSLSTVGEDVGEGLDSKKSDSGYDSEFGSDVSGSMGHTDQKGQGETYFIHSSNNHIMPPIRPAGMSVVRWVVEIAYLLFWYVWFTTACFLVEPLVSSGPSSMGESTETLRDYLGRMQLPRYYISRYFLPLMSSVTTCTHQELLDFPAVDIVGYARRTYRRPHYTVKGGVGRAEKSLSEGLDVKLGARVTGVESLESGKVRVRWVREGTSPGEDGKGVEEEKEYDHAIIAVTPDVVGRIFSPLEEKMRVIPTTSVQSVVHQDSTRILGCSTHLRNNPRFQASTKSTPYIDSTSSTSKPGIASISAPIHIFTDLSSSSSRTESIHEHPSSMLITTYPIDDKSIDDSKVLHRARFTRVLRNNRSRDVVNSIFSPCFPAYADEPDFDTKDTKDEKRHWRNGEGNVFLVGGWCWDGMVMLEGCIVSAIRVAGELGVDVPWV
ncbi:hypothetical protein BJX99DRAFT_252177 [Aspergillus californicus]